MQTNQQLLGCWVPCDSRSSLIAQLPQNAFDLLLTDGPTSWGYIAIDANAVIPIGYADIGLHPIAMGYRDRVFVGVDELLVCYERISRKVVFKYEMPAVFHEFVRFDEDGLIARDEIGFVGVSYTGEERWVFCLDDIIDTYEINQSTISVRTVERGGFKFLIP